MVIDLTAELAPLLWAMLGLLMIAAGGIISNLDPEVVEIYVGERRLLVVTTVLAIVTLGALIAIGPAIAAGLGLPFP
jgi:hypothetical protein